jgi:arylsulfatase
MVIQWPKGIKDKGGIRSQFGHVIDIAPTIYQISGIPSPKVVNGIEQDPIEGTSLYYTFDNAEAEEKHNVQYFEMFGNRGIYQDGWLARTIHRAPWLQNPPQTLQEDVWDLYNTKEDFSLSNNLAAEQPEKLKEMQDLFMKEAEKYHVLPIDDRLLVRMDANRVGRPVLLGDRKNITYVEGMRGMGVDIFIDLKNTAYTITADVEIDNNGQGVIICQGGRFGGISLYVKNGKPGFTYNFLGLESTDIVSSKALPAGKYSIVYTFNYDPDGGLGKGGEGIISVNGEKVAAGTLSRTQPGVFSVDDLADVGMDEGTQVTNYGGPHKFNGKIHKVVIEKRP